MGMCARSRGKSGPRYSELKKSLKKRPGFEGSRAPAEEDKKKHSKESKCIISC